MGNEPVRRFRAVPPGGGDASPEQVGRVTVLAGSFCESAGGVFCGVEPARGEGLFRLAAAAFLEQEPDERRVDDRPNARPRGLAEKPDRPVGVAESLIGLGDEDRDLGVRGVLFAELEQVGCDAGELGLPILGGSLGGSIVEELEVGLGGGDPPVGASPAR